MPKKWQIAPFEFNSRIFSKALISGQVTSKRELGFVNPLKLSHLGYLASLNFHLWVNTHYTRGMYGFGRKSKLIEKFRPPTLVPTKTRKGNHTYVVSQKHMFDELRNYSIPLMCDIIKLLNDIPREASCPYTLRLELAPPIEQWLLPKYTHKRGHANRIFLESRLLALVANLEYHLRGGRPCLWQIYWYSIDIPTKSSRNPAALITFTHKYIRPASWFNKVNALPAISPTAPWSNNYDIDFGRRYNSLFYYKEPKDE